MYCDVQMRPAGDVDWMMDCRKGVEGRGKVVDGTM